MLKLSSADAMKMFGSGGRVNKYGAKKVDIDGIKFDSRHEAYRYVELKYMERIGMISDLRLQVPFEIVPKQLDETGKVAERAVKYVADFVYTKDGKMIVEDAKSPATRTDVYKLKRKLMRHVHGIIIQEV